MFMSKLVVCVIIIIAIIYLIYPPVSHFSHLQQIGTEQEKIPTEDQHSLDRSGVHRGSSNTICFSGLRISSLVPESEITLHLDSQHDEELLRRPSLHHHLFTVGVNFPWFPPKELPELMDTNDDPIDQEQEASNIQRIVDYLYESNVYLEAAETGDVDRLKAIIEEGSIDLQQLDIQGRNALHLAILSDSCEAVELLLKAGVETNVKDNLNISPLSMCLTMNPSMRVVQLLFDYGAKIMPRYSPCDSGLFLQYVIRCSSECTEEEVEILHLLVQKGAIVNDPTAPGGRQALHLAAMSNNLRLIEVLVKMGADLKSTNHRGDTPKETAVMFRCWRAFHYLEDLELAMVTDSGSKANNSALPDAGSSKVAMVTDSGSKASNSGLRVAENSNKAMVTDSGSKANNSALPDAGSSKVAMVTDSGSKASNSGLRVAENSNMAMVTDSGSQANNSALPDAGSSKVAMVTDSGSKASNSGLPVAESSNVAMVTDSGSKASNSGLPVVESSNVAMVTDSGSKASNSGLPVAESSNVAMVTDSGSKDSNSGLPVAESSNVAVATVSGSKASGLPDPGSSDKAT